MAPIKTPTLAVTGNEAVAEAMRQINPDVVAAYPITPQTEIVQIYAQFVADGKVDTEFVTVESEHSAMSAVIGSAAGGARTMTATSAQGFALMWEVLFVAASYRLPIVMTTVNRALSGPINIHCDHSDTMGGRDTGWIQLYGEDHQEAYDDTIMGIRIAEHMDVRTPVMSMLDGYVISGAIGPLQMLPDDVVKEFIGPFKPVNPLLDTKHPDTVGPYDGLHGRYYEHAEIAVVVIGSTAGTARTVVDELRAQGVKAGMVKVHLFRPFPVQAFIDVLGGCKAVGVMDRADSFGAEGGPLFLEVRSALYDLEKRPQIVPIIYGLGGRDIFPDNIREAFALLAEGAKGKPLPVKRTYLNLRKDRV